MITTSELEFPHFTVVNLPPRVSKCFSFNYTSGPNPPLCRTSTPTAKLQTGFFVLFPSMFLGFSRVMHFLCNNLIQPPLCTFDRLHWVSQKPWLVVTTSSFSASGRLYHKTVKTTPKKIHIHVDSTSEESTYCTGPPKVVNIKRCIPVWDDDRWILIVTTVRQKSIPFSFKVEEAAVDHVKKMVWDTETRSPTQKGYSQ